MRKGWKIKTIGEIASVSYGYTDKSHPQGDYRYIRITDIDKNGELEKNGKVYLKSKPDALDFILNENDLLMARTGATFAKVLLYQDVEPSIFASYLIKISFTESILNRLYWYFSKSNDYWEQANKFATGSAQPHFNGAALKKVVFTYPESITEQKQIVAILDKAFTAIDQAKANLEQNIQNAKELFQSKLNEIFSHPSASSGQDGAGWEEKTLQEISVEFGRGKSKHRPRNDKKLFGGSFPFVQTGDVRNSDKFITAYSQTYNDTGLKQSKLWPKGTICITIAANIAETAILEFDSCFPDSIIGLVVNEKLSNRDYVYYALQYLKEELKAKGKGSAQDNINMGTFQSQYFPFPQIEKQIGIVSILDNIKEKTNTLIEKYSIELLHINQLKKSILQKAFAGELTNKEVVA
jgi:type I restriction enzyme, S subunit